MKVRMLLPILAAGSIIMTCSLNAAVTPGSFNNLESVSVSADQIIKDNPNVVFDFFAGWCGPCQRMSPTLSALASEYHNIIFVKVNIESFRGLSGQYGVQSIPTLIFFKNGSVARRTTGLKSKSELKNILTSLY